MLYRKNLGTKERLARLVGGVLIGGWALLHIGVTPLGLLLAGIGAVGALTAMFGFCPACAMVGRRPVDERP